jgi:hypothetical protein
MRVRMDEVADALYIRFDEAPIAESEEVSPGVILDVASSSALPLRARSAAGAGCGTPQALAGVIGAGDFGQIARVEQGQLQGPILSRQRLDRRGAQRGDPVQSAARHILASTAPQ